MQFLMPDLSHISHSSSHFMYMYMYQHKGYTHVMHSMSTYHKRLTLSGAVNVPAASKEPTTDGLVRLSSLAHSGSTCHLCSFPRQPRDVGVGGPLPAGHKEKKL